MRGAVRVLPQHPGRVVVIVRDIYLAIIDAILLAIISGRVAWRSRPPPEHLRGEGNLIGRHLASAALVQCFREDTCMQVFSLCVVHVFAFHCPTAARLLCTFPFRSMRNLRRNSAGLVGCLQAPGKIAVWGRAHRTLFHVRIVAWLNARTDGELGVQLLVSDSQRTALCTSSCC